MYSSMTESELENFIERKINEGFIDPDFLTCMFIDGRQATVYDALELPGQKLIKFKIEDLTSTVKWFKEFDADGYLVTAPEMEMEVKEAINAIEHDFENRTIKSIICN